MAEDTPQQDRTEAATPRRMQRAREEGRVPVSREVQLFSGLAAVTLVLSWSAGTRKSRPDGAPRRVPGTHRRRGHGRSPRGCGWPGPPHGTAPRRSSWRPWRRVWPPRCCRPASCCNGGALQPDFSRISPRAGLGRLFCPRPPDGGAEVDRQDRGAELHLLARAAGRLSRCCCRRRAGRRRSC